MFDSLAEKLQATLADVRGRGTLTEDDVSAAMREIRLALLEADVNFKVVKSFTNAVKERATGSDVLDSLRVFLEEANATVSVFNNGTLLGTLAQSGGSPFTVLSEPRKAVHVMRTRLWSIEPPQSRSSTFSIPLSRSSAAFPSGTKKRVAGLREASAERVGRSRWS